MITLSNTAILILTCNDFEALDLTIAQVLRTTPTQVPIYLLSNCYGLSGADVCEDMCRFASRANYGRVHWINPGRRQPAYYGIRDAIRNHIEAEYILKLDDDAFPVAEGWLEGLIDCYNRQAPDTICYVSALVNNNPYGFSRLATLPELRESYARLMPSPHLAGEFVPGYQDFRISEGGAIDGGGWGTVWQFPHLARWIHQETTLQPERYLALTKSLGEAEFDTSIRYSINVMLFQRDMWETVGNGGVDDEEMFNRYCHQNGRRIVIREDVPFVHLYFGPQKRYLVDMLPHVREAYRNPDDIAGARLVEDWNAFKANLQLDALKKKQ
ncbi:glycosyltransferase family 2 protein [Albidovulum sp.]|uniref:glycosyltransferase family 2 protein n=1 Tax=Albidovulum sp. TaxID=1872424 RepID=UPI0039B95FC8